VAREQAGRVADWIGGRREGRGSLECFSTEEGIGGGQGRRQARVGVISGVRAVGEEVLDGTVLGVGLRWLEEG
jgi:hypothetical protein